MLLNALKATRRMRAESVGYTRKILENCRKHRVIDVPSMTDEHRITEKKAAVDLLNYTADSVLAEKKSMIDNLRKYYSAKELTQALRDMDLYQVCSPEYLNYFLKNPSTGNDEEDERRFLQFDSMLNKQRSENLHAGS